MTPTFSIVLTTYDRQQYLTEAIESVVEQTIDDFELIVVDDASPTAATVRPDRGIRVIRHRTNSGLAAARNTGLEAAVGRYVCFLDDDDLYDPRRLEMVLPALDRSPLVLCWFNHIGSEPHGRTLNGVVASELLTSTTPAMGATTVRRDILQRFDESYLGSQDIEWWIRMSEHPVTTVPEVGYWVRRHDGVRSGNGPVARIAASRRMLEQHAHFFERHPKAAAFRWKRIGMMCADVGDRRAALDAYARSMRLHRDPKTIFHVARLLLL